METLAAHLALLQAPVELIQRVMASGTTDEAIEYIFEDGYGHVFDQIASAITRRCSERVHGEIRVGTILFTKAHGYLGRCTHADTLEEGFRL
jgi:cobalt-precorrin-5B (C1)-methyltransferase